MELRRRLEHTAWKKDSLAQWAPLKMTDRFEKDFRRSLKLSGLPEGRQAVPLRDGSGAGPRDVSRPGYLAGLQPFALTGLEAEFKVALTGFPEGKSYS